MELAASKINKGNRGLSFLGVSWGGRQSHKVLPAVTKESPHTSQVCFRMPKPDKVPQPSEMAQAGEPMVWGVYGVCLSSSYLQR